MMRRHLDLLMPWRKAQPRVAVLRLNGVIASGGRLGTGLNLGAFAGTIQRAFAMEPKAVALAINSPGGSPVQSHLIYKRIRALSVEKNIPVVAFVEDVAASGGYMLACAADEIFADESSILGSIGVVSAGFGFTGLIEKLGIERRVHTAGERKNALDPFRPEDPGDVARLEALQRDVHEMFKALVRARRGAKLKGEEGELFSGDFWAGGEALKRGLVDGIGDLKTVLEARFGKKVQLAVVSTPRTLRQRLGLASHAPRAGALAAGLAEAALDEIETRALWARYGL